MARENSQLGINKRDFKERYTSNYSQWLAGKTFEKPEAVLKSTYLSPGIVLRPALNEEGSRAETDSAVPDHTIFGFKNEIESLKNFLLDRKVYKEFKTLVIVGEYGVGKTALCKTIFNDDDVKSVYAPMIWVSMHDIPEKEAAAEAVAEAEVEKKKKKISVSKKIFVLKKILEDLGFTNEMFKFINEEADQEASTRTEKGEFDIRAETEELSALLYALHLDLRWTKYLIVFDDVREEDNWDEILEDDEEKLKKDKRWGRYLSDGFPKGSGGRVIYTTRDEKKNLAKKLVSEEHEIHRLWPLTDPKSVWDIYEAAVTENGVKEPPRNDKKCLDELMNKSRGLPLAVRSMATLLPVFFDDLVENDSRNGPTNPASDYAPLLRTRED